MMYHRYRALEKMCRKYKGTSDWKYGQHKGSFYNA